MERDTFFNWKEDDKTYLLSNFLSGLIPAGVYRGFNPHAVSAWTIELRHAVNADNGYTDYDQAKDPTVGVGVWTSPQGSTIKRVDVVSLTLAPAHASLDRIDLIVGQHGYTEVTGGNPATYYIATGTPSVTPVAPSVSVAATDTILGMVFVKGGTGSILDPAHILTRSRTPDLGNFAMPVLDLLDKGVSAYSYTLGKDLYTIDTFYHDFDITGFINTITDNIGTDINPDMLYIVKGGDCRKVLVSFDPNLKFLKQSWGVYKGRIYRIDPFVTNASLGGPAKKLVYDPAGNYTTGITAVPVADTVTSPKEVIPVTTVSMMNREQSFNEWSVLTAVGGVTVSDTLRCKRVGQVLHFWGAASMPTSLVNPTPNVGEFTTNGPDFAKSDIATGNGLIKLLGVGVASPFSTGVNLENLFFDPLTAKLYITDEAQGATTSISLKGKYVILPDCYVF